MNVLWSSRKLHVAFSVAVLLGAGCNNASKRVAKSSTDPFADSHYAEMENDDDDSSALAQKTPLRSKISRGDLKQVGNEVDSAVRAAASRRQVDSTIIRTSSEQRALDSVDCPCPNPNVAESACAASEDYPDEYICDGGDRHIPLSYDGKRMQGLETEDTAAEYVDDLDKRKIAPSNKVCIYAPRFGSVSSISEPVEGVGSGRPVQSVATQLGTALSNRDVAIAQQQREPTEGLVNRARGSAVSNLTGAEVTEQPIAIGKHTHTSTIAQEFSTLVTGRLSQADELRLATSITSALSFSRAQYPEISAVSQQGMELRSTFRQTELTGIENRNGGRGVLRIIKMTDAKTAQSGDIVTFTIRYDNIGDSEVHDVVIIDNLTPRLEYVDDSAQCDVDGRLDLEDNGEGSQILRWILEEPVAPHKGGVVSFQARVK